MTHPIEVDFTIGEIVYFRLDDDPQPGLVTGITITGTGPFYTVTWPSRNSTNHYAFELTKTRTYARPIGDAKE